MQKHRLPAQGVVPAKMEEQPIREDKACFIIHLPTILLWFASEGSIPIKLGSGGL